MCITTPRAVLERGTDPMLTGATNEAKIWNYLKAKGLSDCGVAGLMGNLYAESGLIPTNLENGYEKKLGFSDGSYTAAVDNGTYHNFTSDSAGYGLAQWTYSTRKAALLAYAKNAGASIGDLETQLGFLVKELTGSYPGLWTALRVATSVAAASTAVLTQFERPQGMNDPAVQSKRAGFGQTYYNKYAKSTAAATPAATAKEGSTVDRKAKITTGKQLAERALDVAQNFKTLYVMGCFGSPMTPANKTRYCNNHTYNKAATRQRMINAATEDTFGFDCVCFIKGLLWGWYGDTAKQYGGAAYTSNGVPDISADGMIAVCSGVSTDFSKIEVGEAVWLKGHIGIYIGDGLAVECSPKWANKVQVTAVGNIGAKAGYNTRTWTKHGKLPYITYGGNVAPAAPAAPVQTAAPTTGTAQAVKTATDYATGRDNTLTGAYKTTAPLYLRTGAGTNKPILIMIPKGGTVRNYGYYSVAGGVKWLYVQTTVDGKTYTGFCSSQYLTKT